MAGATISTLVSLSCMETIMQSCRSALLKEAPIAIIYADAILAIKFNMTQAKHKVKGYNIVYKVPQEVHEHILGEVSLFNAWKSPYQYIVPENWKTSNSSSLFDVLIY